MSKVPDEGEVSCQFQNVLFHIRKRMRNQEPIKKTNLEKDYTISLPDLESVAECLQELNRFS